MTRIGVRRAVEQDAARIAEVRMASWRAAYRGIVPAAFLADMESELPVRVERWRAVLQDPAREPAFVAEDPDQGIIGFIRGGRARPPHFGMESELSTLYLLREFWRQGLGRELTQALVTQLIHQGFRTMITWVFTANPATSFYERLGGCRLGTQRIVLGGVSLPMFAYGWTDLPTAFHA